MDGRKPETEPKGFEAGEKHDGINEFAARKFLGADLFRSLELPFQLSFPSRDSMTWQAFDRLVPPGEFVEPKYEPIPEDVWMKKMYPALSNEPGTTLYGTQYHSDVLLREWHDRQLWDEFAVRVTYRDSVNVTHPLHITETCIYAIWSNAANPQCPRHNYQK